MSATISPASELLALLEKWAVLPAKKAPFEARDEGDGWWVEHANAVTLAAEVERQALSLSAEHPELKYSLPVFKDVHRLIFSVGVGLETRLSSDKRMFPETALQTYAGLAAALNLASRRSSSVESTEMFAALAEVDSLIGSASLTEEVSDYLSSLSQKLREAIQHTVVDGGTDIRALAFELFTALGFYVNTDEPDKLHKVMDRLLKATARLIMVDVPLAIGTNVVATEILAARTS